MVGRVFLVTGASDGIGKHTALRLAQTRATVLMHGRNKDKTHQAKSEITKKTGNESKQVRRLSEEIHSKHSYLDVIINNAGVYMPDREESEDGYEMTFAVNVLAPFLLTSLLMDLLRSGKSAALSTYVSSVTHDELEDFNLDDLNSKLKYGDGIQSAYALSKTCEIMYTYKTAELLKGTGITVNCLDPGNVNTKMLILAYGPIGIPIPTDPALDGVSGKYFVDDKETESSAFTNDKDLQDKLWDILVGITGAVY